MIKVITESGSNYEIDLENSQIRRIEGTHEPTPRQGPDGIWKKYDTLGSIEVGKPLLIVWAVVNGTVAQSTITSPVTAKVV